MSKGVVCDKGRTIKHIQVDSLNEPKVRRDCRPTETRLILHRLIPVNTAGDPSDQHWTDLLSRLGLISFDFDRVTDLI